MSTPTHLPVQVDKAPIFVVGAPRSGTTLTSQILGRHHSVYASGESHYFEDIWTRRRELGELIDEGSISLAALRLMTLFGRFNFPVTQEVVDFYLTPEKLSNRTQALGGGYGALYYAFMSSLAERVGKIRFCDDTPKHLYYLETIFSFFPNAKVIGCIRDPRDFLYSYKNYWRKSTESSRVKELYHPVITSLLWRSSSNLLLKYAKHYGNDRMIVIQYGKLVEHPEEEVKRLCGFLELDYSRELLQIETNNSSFNRATTGIFTTSVGRWHTGLNAEEIWWVQTLARNNMGAFAYEVEPVNPSRQALFVALVNTPFALFKAIRVNSQKRGPFLKYILQRLPALLRL